jgi:hypothetical protein
MDVLKTVLAARQDKSAHVGMIAAMCIYYDVSCSSQRASDSCCAGASTAGLLD